MSDPAVQPWAPPSISVIRPATVQEEYEQTLAAARQQGYDEGFRQGLEEGMSDGRRQAQTLLAEMSAIWEAMQSPFLDLEQEVQTQLLGLAMAVARAVVERELITDETAVAGALSTALESLTDANDSLQVMLNPADRAQIEDLLEQQRITAELVANPNMMRGGCLLRRGGALVDATIESRMMAAIESLASAQNAEIPDDNPAESYRERPLDPDAIAAIAARFHGGEDAD